MCYFYGAYPTLEICQQVVAELETSENRQQLADDSGVL